jgi:hypothetical protein
MEDIKESLTSVIRDHEASKVRNLEWQERRDEAIRIRKEINEKIESDEEERNDRSYASFLKGTVKAHNLKPKSEVQERLDEFHLEEMKQGKFFQCPTCVAFYRHQELKGRPCFHCTTSAILKDKIVFLVGQLYQCHEG